MNKKGRPRNWEKSYESYKKYAAADEARGIPHRKLLSPEAYRAAYYDDEAFTPTERKNKARTIYMNLSREVSSNMVKFTRKLVSTAKADVRARSKAGEELQEWEREVLGWKTSTTNLLKNAPTYYQTIKGSTIEGAALFWENVRQQMS